MPTCWPSWGGIGPVLGCSHCPQFHWDVTDWAILILCRVADSCCGQFCVPGCVNRVLFWCLAPDSRLNPDLPLLSTPLEQLTGALRAFSVSEITQTRICWIQALEAAVVNTLSCLGHGGSLGAARWGELVPSLTASGWGPSQGQPAPPFLGSLCCSEDWRDLKPDAKPFRPWFIFCAQVRPEPAGGAGFPSSTALCSGDAFFLTYCWDWVGCFFLFPNWLFS